MGKPRGRFRRVLGVARLGVARIVFLSIMAMAPRENASVVVDDDDDDDNDNDDDDDDDDDDLSR